MSDPSYVAGLLDGFEFILPEIVLGVVACVLFLGGLFRSDRHLWATVALLGLLGAAVALGFIAPISWHITEAIQAAHSSDDKSVLAILYAGPLAFDSLALFVKVLTLAGGAVLVLFSWNQVPDRQAADYYACLLILLAGLGITGAANDLVTLFVALELISIPTYVILYLPRHDNASQEAAVKYFLLSIFSSALLLFGFSYLYGLAGTTNLAALMNTLNHADPGQVPRIAEVGMILVVAGLGFRITAVPFHFYAPDVYQGTATVLAAMLSFVPKVAGFAALLRVLGFVLPPDVNPRQFVGNYLIGMSLSEQVPIFLWFLAVLTMTFGNLLALLQDNLKRLLAYSSVAHAGYMLMALASAPYLRQEAFAPGGGSGGPDGVTSLLFYLAAYGSMTVGAFAVLAYLSGPGRSVETVDDLAGLSASHPGVALLMVIFLFSLIGIPLTAGFAGKLLIFFGAMAVPSDREHTVLFQVLALIGVLNAAVGAWYYLRLVAVMYLRTPLRPLENRRNYAGLATMLVCAVLTIGLGVPPGIDWLQEAVRGASGPHRLAGQRAVPVAQQVPGGGP